MKNDLDAFLFMVECGLATVSHMAGMKSKSKSEYNRQIQIVQKALNYLFSAGHLKRDDSPKVFQVSDAMNACVEWRQSRLKEILNTYDGNIQAWAKQWEPENTRQPR
jgi:hypothetical protein